MHLDQVLDAELKHIRHHRHPDKEPHVVARSLVGLALSGGGIRSATTNLGVLQALSRMGVLPLVDYLSTVSGGGYIGACLSSLLSWNGSREPSDSRDEDSCVFSFAPEQPPQFSTEWERFPFRTEEKDEGGRLGNALVAHLRTHGNFLVTRAGAFSRESLRGAAAILVGTLFNTAGFALMLFVAAAMYLMFLFAAAPDLPRVLAWETNSSAAMLDISTRALVDRDSSVRRTTTVSSACAPGVPDCLTATATTTALTPPTFGDVLGRNVRLYKATLFYLPASPEPAGDISWLRRMWMRIPNATQPLAIAFVVGALAGLLSMLWMRRSFRAYLDNGSTDEITHERGDSAEDGFENRVLRTICLFFAALAIATPLAVRLIWTSRSQSEQLIVPLAPAAVLLGAWLITYAFGVAYLPHKRSYTRRLRSLAAEYHAITGWGLAFLLAAGFAPMIIYALRYHATATGISALGSFLATRLLVNRSGPGVKLIASPTARRILLNVAVTLLILVGFLFAAALLAGGIETLRMAAFTAAVLLAVYVPAGWLVNMNRIGVQYFYRDRLAETYLLSELPDLDGRLELYRDTMEAPLHELHGVCPDDWKWRNPAPYQLISAAINLAGSRDLTRKDRKSGYWLFSRLYCGSTHTGFRWTARYRKGETKLANAVAISGGAVSSAMGRITFFAQSFAAALFNIRLGAWVENPLYPESSQRQESGVFWPRYLLREALMDTTETKRLVNLSDGGHTGDNLGIYPLMQRHCKVIIACDAECDPECSFNSLTEALRHAYVDMGIAVDLDLSMLRPDPVRRLSRSHCAVGRIRYPDRPDQESWLVYLKSSLTGDEPAPLLNYKVHAPAFPHESTADQFFDDAQFEAYRALGVHIAEETFDAWTSSAAFVSVRDHHAPLSELGVRVPAGAGVMFEAVTITSLT